MRRAATSLLGTAKTIDMDTFKSTAFFSVKEVDAYYIAEEWMVKDETGFACPVRTQDFIKSPDKKVLVNATNGNYISTVGKNYKIVDNEQYFNSVISSLEASEVKWEPRAVFNDGKSTSMIVNLPEFGLFKGSDEAQDFELRIRNSFDTTIAASTILGFLRLICTNGMTSFTQDFNYRLLHKGDVLYKHEQALELYKNFHGVWEANERMITRLGNANGNKQAIAEYIGDGEFTNNAMFKGPRWAKKLLQKWQEEGEPNNLWKLYNMFTYIASHEYGNSYNSKLNIMDKLNDEARTWPKRFKVVGADPFKLAA